MALLANKNPEKDRTEDKNVAQSPSILRDFEGKPVAYPADEPLRDSANKPLSYQTNQIPHKEDEVFLDTATNEPQTLSDTADNKLLESQQEQQYLIDQEEDRAQIEEEQQELDLENELEAEYQAGVAKLAEEGMSFGGPSLFKYFVLLMPLAIIVDAVDFLDVSAFTGVLFFLVVIAKVFSFFCWMVLLFIMWFTDTKIKKAHSYGANLESQVNQLQILTSIESARARISKDTRLALKGAKILRKVPGMKGASRGIVRGMVKIRKIARRNPLTKVFIGGAINLIPLVSILNLLSMWVFWSYLDERKTYRQAREAAEDLLKNSA